MCTVSQSNGTDAAVCFLDPAASTSRRTCCTNGHASSTEGAGDFYARIAGADAWGPVRADKEEIGRTEKVKSGKGQLET